MLVAHAQEDNPGKYDVTWDMLDYEHLELDSSIGEQKVVTASRTSKKISELPVAVYVVSHEEIIKHQYYSLTDVLKSLPGIRVSVPGSGETGETFEIRGLAGNMYTKILVNGLPVKPTVVKGMPLGAQLPIRQADRIEIIYGPAAAVYGADAVAGVVNIITKQAEKGTFVKADISLGQNEYDNINFMVGGKAGKNENILQYSFYGSRTVFNNMNVRYQDESVYNPMFYLQEKKQKINIDGKDYNPIEINKELLDVHDISVRQFINQYYGDNYEGSLTYPDMQDLSSASNMIGVHLKYKGFSASLHNMYRKTHSSLGMTSYLYKYNNPQNYWGDNINQATLNYKKAITDKLFSTTNISNLNYKMDNNSSMGLTFLDSTDKAYRYAASNDLLVEELLTYMTSKNLETMLGLSYQASANLPVTDYLSTPFNSKDYNVYRGRVIMNDSLVKGFGFNPVSFHNVSGFLQGYYRLKEKTRLMGGVRYDHNSLYGKSVNPRIAALYKAGDETSFRSSLGYAFKAPPASVAYESLSFYSGEAGGIMYRVVPNSGLKPEIFRSFEMGMYHELLNYLDMDISLFVNRIDNLILNKYIPVGPLNLPMSTGDSASTKINSKNAYYRLYGAQGVFKKKNIIPKIKMDVELSMTYAKQSRVLPGLDSIINLIQFMPEHHGQLKLSFKPTERLYIHFEHVWMTKWLRLLIPIEKIYNDLFDDVDGYYAMDAIINYELSMNLNAFIKVINVFDEKYGGLNATHLRENLPFNPQLGRNIRFGLTYSLN